MALIALVCRLAEANLARTCSTGQDEAARQARWRTAMRVQVDRDACEANAVCAQLVPEVFEVDDADQLHIASGEVPAELADTVRLAVRSCPKAALSLTE
jgi:ferredoxin